MKLPHAELATVPERKITRYLLNPAHPVGGSKAAFFLRFGFTVADWRLLVEVLLRHSRQNELVEIEKTQHGTRYVVEVRWRHPTGTSLKVRNAWYIDKEGGAPRFVTAHPLPKT